MLRKLLRDTTGASALEYAIIAALISVAAIGAFALLGQQSGNQLDRVNSAYQDAG